MATSLDLAKTYTSYSGVDIRVVVNGEAVGSMQAISYAIQREKAPIYVMGRVDPRSFSRGKRGIAGTMISLLLDRHLLYSGSFTGEAALLDNDEVFVYGAPGDRRQISGASETSSHLDPVGQPGFKGFLINNTGQTTLNAVGEITENGPSSIAMLEGYGFNSRDLEKNYSVAPVFYVDQILPFDVTIVAVNEYGNAAQMRMYGCEILNEGSGFSIDDMVVENQMTYICRTILPWQSFSGGETAPGKRDGWIRELYSMRTGIERSDSAG